VNFTPPDPGNEAYFQWRNTAITATGRFFTR
jgi:hypothetical protein